MPDSFFVTGIALSQFYFAGERLGLPSEEVLRSIGLDPTVALQPMSQVSVEHYEQFILEMVLRSGDEMFGFHIGQQVMPALYGVLPTIAFSSMTGRQAIELCVQYQSLAIGNAGALQISESGDSLFLTWSCVHQNPVIRRHIAESGAVLLANLVRFISGQPGLTARRVCFEHSPCSEEARQQLLRLARCPVHFGAPSSMLELGPEVLNMVLNAYGDDALAMAEGLAREQIIRQQQGAGRLAGIRLLMRDMMVTSSPRREVVADRLGISVRTLDRRLADEGMTWQQLLDGMRVQLARELLLRPDQTVRETASQLGFADLRAFQRRFRHWTGMSPSEYRALHG